MKLTVDPNEKKLLTQRFNHAADVARSAKDNTWAPLKSSASIPGGNDTVKTNTQTSSADTASMTGTSRPGANNAEATRSQLESHSTQTIGGIVQWTPNIDLLLHDKSDDDDIRMGHSQSSSESQVDPAAQDNLNARFAHATLKETPTQPQISHVRTLREPLSSRKRTTKEEIILLKASIVNDVKCPPWNKSPSADEFSLHLTGIYT